MFECKAILHDRSLAKFKKPNEDGYTAARLFPCYIILDKSAGLKFFENKNAKEEAFSIDPIKMTTDLDKISR